MKYIDYPENLPNLLVEKLNNEYNYKKKLKESAPFTINTSVQNSTNPANTLQDEPVEETPNLNNLTNLEIQNLAQTSATQFSNIIFMLTKLLNYYSNSTDKTTINEIISNLTQQKNSFVTIFNVTNENFVPSSATVSRRCLKQKIAEEFFQLLSNLLELYNLSPSNYGLYAINKNTLFNFYRFYNLSNVN